MDDRTTERLPALYHYHTEVLRNVARINGGSGHAAAVAPHLETHSTMADVTRHCRELAEHGYLTLHDDNSERAIELVALVTSKVRETWPRLLMATQCPGSASGHHTYRYGACDNCRMHRTAVETDAAIRLTDAIDAADRIREREN